MMTCCRDYRVTAVALVIVAFSFPAQSRVITTNQGSWPEDWPEELEPLRERARTIEVSHGVRELVYEIPFDSRSELRQYWPFILSLASPGAPVFVDSEPSFLLTSGSSGSQGIRIRTHDDNVVEFPDGNRLHAGEPWPAHLRGPEGELPEYVVNRNGHWRAHDGLSQGRTLFRCRTDITIILGDIIRGIQLVPLPDETTIIDLRKLTGPVNGMEKNIMSPDVKTSETLTLTRELPASPAQVFAAWTTPEAMKQWFAPGDYTVPLAETDPREGGAFKVQMEAPDKPITHTVTGVYETVIPNEHLKFSWRWEREDAVETRVEAIFDKIEGGTELQVTHTGFPNAEERDKHMAGWSGCLDNLDAYLRQ